MSTVIPSDISLLQKIAAGDAVAFEKIYYRYQPKIYQYCLKLLHEPPLAEEVAQEVMLKLWTLGHELTSIENLDAWLKRVTRNRTIDLLRANRNNPMQSFVPIEEELAPGLNFTEEIVLLRDARRLLNEAIAKLPEQQQKVYLLSEQEGWRAEQIAEQLELKINTVYTHLKLARRNVKNYLTQYLDIIVVGIILNFF